MLNVGFPGSSMVKNPSANAGDPGSIPGQEDPLEKEMAIHSSILVWEIPCTEDCQAAIHGSQRVKCDLVTKQRQ